MTVIDSRREAANSMASGIPSRRRQISVTASVSLSSEAAGAMAEAVSMNNFAASELMSRDGQAKVVRRSAAAPLGWLRRS